MRRLFAVHSTDSKVTVAIVARGWSDNPHPLGSGGYENCAGITPGHLPFSTIAWQIVV